MFCISLSNILVYFSAFILSCPFWKELCPTIILHNVLESIVFIIQLLEFVQTIGEKCNKRILVCSFVSSLWIGDITRTEDLNIKPCFYFIF